LNASQPTPQIPVAPTAAVRFVSALSRFLGVKPVGNSGQSEPALAAAPVETIWSADWCAKEPELASIAIATLQDRIGTLEDYIKAKEPKPRKQPMTYSPQSVRLSSLTPNTRFKLLRTGETYFTGESWKAHFKASTGKKAKLHGLSHVVVLTQKLI